MTESHFRVETPPLSPTLLKGGGAYLCSASCKKFLGLLESLSKLDRSLTYIDSLAESEEQEGHLTVREAVDLLEASADLISTSEPSPLVRARRSVMAGASESSTIT